MSVSVRLGADQLTIDPGSTVTLGVEVRLLEGDSDRYELSVEGLDPGWVAIPAPTFDAVPGEVTEQKVFFKPSRESDSLAGSYPFVVKVRSLTTGESRTAPGVLTLRTFHHLTADVNPRRALAGANEEGDPAFRLSVTNMGNSEETLQVSVTDPDNAVAYEPERESVTVAPGQTVSIGIPVTPKRRKLIGSVQLHSLTITARSTTQPAVGANTQATLEQRGVISPSWLVGMIALLLLVVGWIAMMPKAPRLISSKIAPESLKVGEVVNLEWTASDAESVRLQIGSQNVDEKLAARDVYTWTPTEPGQYVVTITPVRNNWNGTPVVRTITVLEPERVPDPEILAFDIEPKRARIGETLQVRYRLSDSVVKASLSPIGRDLNPRLDGVQIPADGSPGRVTYRLVVENAEGKMASQSVDVELYEGTDATIVAFQASATEVDLGLPVKLEWTVTGAVRVELAIGNEKQAVDTNNGTVEINLPATTKVTLTAIDANGRSATKTLTITVKDPNEVPPVDENNPPATTGTTAGGGRPPTTGGATGGNPGGGTAGNAGERTRTDAPNR